MVFVMFIVLLLHYGKIKTGKTVTFEPSTILGTRSNVQTFSRGLVKFTLSRKFSDSFVWCVAFLNVYATRYYIHRKINKRPEIWKNWTTPTPNIVGRTSNVHSLSYNFHNIQGVPFVWNPLNMQR